MAFEFGGWTSFRILTEDDKKIFDTALMGFVGVHYVPLLVATQLVSGTNYCFLCKGKGVYPDAQEFAALIYINVSSG